MSDPPDLGYYLEHTIYRPLHII